MRHLAIIFLALAVSGPLAAHHSCEWRCNNECSPQVTPSEIANCVAQCVEGKGFKCSHCGHDGCKTGPGASACPVGTSCEARCKHKCPWYEVPGCVSGCVSGRPPECTPTPASEWLRFHWPTCHDSWPDCIPPTSRENPA